MDGSSKTAAWSGGDPLSHALLQLTADRGLPEGTIIGAGLVELAQRHGLIGILADAGSNTLTRAIQGRELARRTVMERHLARLLDRFDHAGLRVAVVKGPGIAERYRLPRHRPFTDLDLLVEAERLDDALSLLAADEAVGEIPPKRPKADKRDITLTDPSGVRFNVDLHWDLFSYSQLRGAARGAVDVAWDQAVKVTDSSLGPVWRIPDAIGIAFLASHAVLDHRFRLILFRDFLELARDEIDWEALQEVATRWGLRSTTFLALWMARNALGVNVPGEFLSAVYQPSIPIRYLRLALPRTDLVRFDGHHPHPINLAVALLNDSPASRVALFVRSPFAVPGWRRRVASEARSDPTPRTLILASTDRRRGAEVFTERLRDGLAARGWVVEAIGLRATGANPAVDFEALVEAGSRPPRRFEWSVQRSLRSRIKAFQPDLVIANGGATLRYGVAARLGLDFRLAYIGIGEPTYWIRSRWSRTVNRWLLRRADLVLTVSEMTRRQLLELEPGLMGRIHTAHTGVPDDLFSVEAQPLDGPLRILMVGSLTAEKDPMRAIRCVAAVDGVVLRLVGDGPLLDSLRSEALRLGVADRVEFVGAVPRDELLSAVAAAGVLLHPALHDESPLVVAEALSLGTPVVCLAHGGPAELVRHWPTPSETIPPSRPDETARRLAAALDGFLAEPLPVPERPVMPTTSFAKHIRDAYTFAAGRDEALRDGTD